ncbi:MAG: hypothetical protein QOJ32_1660 [Frankiaceae bacterium]|jgi:hypothetical protein|nr:hypothetical protein [Frankiaceae bacterium]
MNWFWHALWIAFVIIPLTLLWTFCLVDVFVRRDLSGWARFAWVFAILVLPLFGPLAYLVSRPQPVDVVNLRTAEGRSTEVSDVLVADEVLKLDRLRSDGVITDQEFAAQKARLLTVPSQRDAGRSAQHTSRV